MFCYTNKVLWQLKPEYHEVMWSESSCRAVGNQLGTDRQVIGDRLVTVSWAYVYNNKKGLRLFGDQSTTDQRSVGNWKPCWDCLQPLRLVGDQSPTSPEPPCNHQKLFYNWFGPDRFHLQQAKPPCNQIDLVTFLRLLQPICACLATPPPPPPPSPPTPAPPHPPPLRGIMKLQRVLYHHWVIMKLQTTYTIITDHLVNTKWQGTSLRLKQNCIITQGIRQVRFDTLSAVIYWYWIIHILVYD